MPFAKPYQFGEPLNSEVIKVFLETFKLQVRDGYGQTENTLLVGTMVGMEARVGSMGNLLPATLLKLLMIWANPLQSEKWVILLYIVKHRPSLKNI